MGEPIIGEPITGGSGNRRRYDWAWLAAALAVAAFLRLYRIEDHGFGSLYYAAGVRSHLQGAWLFFYNAFDPAGFITLDKPPVAFWIQTIFAALFGYSGFVLHLPQALVGTASVAILYSLVRRPFGGAAAAIAAFLLALSPIAVAIDRSNNTDSWLVLFLMLAAAAALRGRGLSLVVSMMLLGIAFNVKMAAALICGPALLAGWWASGTLDWQQRFGWMMAAGATLVVVGLGWAVVFDLTPKDMRPYAGSTKDNSMLELIVKHNAMDRFTLERARPTTYPMYDAVPSGPLKLAEPRLAAQVAWLLPIALLGLLLARRRSGIDATIFLWAIWLLTYGAVLSAAGGIFHLYYLAPLAPPIAALAGIGFVQFWRRGPNWLAAGLAATAAWQIWIAGASLGWLSTWLGFPAVALLAAAASVWRRKRPPSAIGAFSLMILPTAWALSALFSPGNLLLPSASLPRWLGIDDGRGPVLSRNYLPLSDDPKLVEYLLAHRGDAKFLAATLTAPTAAPLIVRTGLPVMAVGGYFGDEPILTIEQFAVLVARGEVRYVLLSNASRSNEFTQWVRTNGRRVEETQWRSVLPAGRPPLVLYELKAN